MKKFCVYLITYVGDKLPPFYIGSTSVEKLENGYRGSVSSKRYKKIWDLELKENSHLFKYQILTEFDTREEATTEELYWHLQFGVVKSPDFINLSLARKNGFYGRDVSGEKNPFFGKKHSVETNFLISNANTGKVRTEEFKQKLSDICSGENHAMYGRHHSEETKLLLSLKNKTSGCGQHGEEHHMYGKRHTPEVLEKISMKVKERYKLDDSVIEEIIKMCNEKYTYVDVRRYFINMGIIIRAGRISKIYREYLENKAN